MFSVAYGTMVVHKRAPFRTKQIDGHEYLSHGSKNPPSSTVYCWPILTAAEMT